MWINLKKSILILHCRHQGYTETDIPTHTQIQKCLVEIGDKERSFIGSKQWIGSTEVGFVLDRACEVQSKFLSVSSGDEMSSKGRELSHHFKTQGTPIMIGIIYSLEEQKLERNKTTQGIVNRWSMNQKKSYAT